MKPLRERNQAAVGAVAIAAIALASAGAFYADNLPFIGGGTGYSAYFVESAGLVPGDQVKVAGVQVGKVTDVELDRGRVRVEFRVDGVRVGDASRASIEIRTLLGDKFLALTGGGQGRQDPAVPIPVERTSTPFEIPDTLGKLATTVEGIDTQQLARSFDTLSKTFADTPEHVGAAMTGLSRLAESVASRDQELASLLASANNVSGVLAERNGEVARLISDGTLLLDELQRRRGAITALLEGTQHLADELRGLVADNREQLRPTLEQLDKVTELLQRNQDNLSRSIAAMAVYSRAFNNVVGNGRWFDGYLCGLLPPTVNAGALQINPGGCPPPDTGEFPITGGHR
ncbi:MCE family protein [Pseudonocardia sp. CA-107938]|uniref:MCE family protein n=1 Tax=Pseudonocardia sp. CA-107938 TaxID=3240021 RepID=UPI003D943E4F